MSMKSKKLLWAAVLPGAAALLRFGGGAVLALFGMGWRLGPRYTMDYILVALLIITAFRFVQIAATSGDSSYSGALLCILSLLTISMLLVSLFFLAAFNLFRLTEQVVVQDGQTVVREYKINGGVESYCYAHVNSLIRGKDLHIDYMEWSDYQGNGVPLPISDPPLPRVTVELPSGHATIRAVDREDGTELWAYTTDRLETTRPREITGIGLIGDGYFFVCGGSVICLDARTGQERWRNDDYGGKEFLYVVGGETIYLCGYYGPDLYAISTEGETVKRIDTLYSGYHSLSTMELSGDTLTVFMHEGPDADPETRYPIQVNVSDWSITL